MTEAERKQYAKDLIEDHAKDIEMLTIYEVYEGDYGTEISEEDQYAVRDLIDSAQVVVSWPEDEVVIDEDARVERLQDFFGDVREHMGINAVAA